jgi:hypothetical protein
MSQTDKMLLQKYENKFKKDHQLQESASQLNDADKSLIDDMDRERRRTFFVGRRRRSTQTE